VLLKEEFIRLLIMTDDSKRSCCCEVRSRTRTIRIVHNVLFRRSPTCTCNCTSTSIHHYFYTSIKCRCHRELYRYGNSYGESNVRPRTSAWYQLHVEATRRNLILPDLPGLFRGIGCCATFYLSLAPYTGTVQYKYIQTITSGTCTTVGKFLGTVGYSVLQCRV
jgi:hypothetical protein